MLGWQKMIVASIALDSIQETIVYISIALGIKNDPWKYCKYNILKGYYSYFFFSSITGN